MQFEDRVEAVKHPSKFDQIDLVGVTPNFVEQLNESMNAVGNLDMGSTHRPHWIATTEEAPKGWVEDTFFRFFMWQDDAYEALADLACVSEVDLGFHIVQTVSNSEQIRDDARNLPMLIAKSSSQSRIFNAQSLFQSTCPHRPQRIEDYESVDELLKDRSPRRG